MYEVHSHLDEPEQGGALVLIDEIAAHMHPSWQQGLVPALARTFETVQFVANTHSPLVVGSMDPEDVKIVHRAPLVAPVDGLVQVREGSGGWQEVLVKPDEGDPHELRVPPSAGLLVRDGHTVGQGDRLTKEDAQVAVDPMGFDARGWRADQLLTSPAFDLNTSRNPETEQVMLEYTRLAAMDKRLPEDEKQYLELAQELEMKLPSPQESEEARKAFELIRASVSAQLEEIPEEDRAKVLDEVKVQLLEAVTRSRRPRGGSLDSP
jgi:hypothetical protein